MNQRKYALELISEMGLSGAKPVHRALDPNVRLSSIKYDSHVQGPGATMIDKPLQDTGKISEVGW